MPPSLVWFITGCSTGLGRQLALSALASGARVVATARQAATLADLPPERLLTLPLDVTDASQRAQAVAQALAHFGRIDVLVNNAGYGYQSTAEEGDDARIRALFETDVFAVFALTRQVLPLMRAQGSGQVLSIGSVAGLLGLPGSGYYAAAKHALEGWTDALHAEIEPLGLRASCIEPGPLRTDFAGRSLQQTPTTLPEYAATAGARQKATRQSDGQQAGDPRRCADLIVELVHGQRLPRHLVLGQAAAQMAIRKLSSTVEQLRAWQQTSKDADYPT
jgi:NAD(P)-dependent dehydrogenase (short-subunit alcohol dehydrogenase family)